MKRVLSIFYFLTWAIVTLAYDVEVNGLYFEVYPEYRRASVSVSKGDSYTGDICIPESVLYEGEEYPVTSIGMCAFGGCRGVTSVIIPNTVKSIGELAFSSTQITSIDLPSSVTFIGKYAFNRCELLSTIVIPDSVTFLGEMAFQGCIELTSVIIGNSLEEISNNEFENCANLTSVTLGNSIKKIGPYAFRFNHNLSDINFPKSLIEIESSAFEDCRSLKSISLGSSVTKLGSMAFCWCKELESVILSASLTDIEPYVFSGCQKLSSVTNLSTEPQDIADKYVFYRCDLSQCTLHVVPGCKNLYESAEGWKDFAVIVEDADPASIAIQIAEDAEGAPVFNIFGIRITDAPAEGLLIRNHRVMLIK